MTTTRCHLAGDVALVGENGFSRIGTGWFLAPEFGTERRTPVRPRTRGRRLYSPMPSVPTTPSPSPTGPYLQMAVICEKVLREEGGPLSLIRVVDRVTQTAEGT